MIVGSFISAYLTDSVGIRVATVSTMMLVNRVFDLFSDFLMGYQGTAIVYGVAAGVLILIGFFGTKENIADIEETKAQPEQSVPFKEAVGCLAKNKYFWLEMAFFALLLLHNLSGGMVPYYFCNVVLGDAGYVAILSACGMIPALAMNLILPNRVKKFGKRKMMIAGSITVIATSALMGLFTSVLPMVAVLYAIKGFMMGAMFSCAFALTGDVVDYGEWKFGVRSEGLVMSGVSIGQKIGLGFGPAIASINFPYTYLVAIIGVIILLVCLAFNIDKYTAKMQEDLTKKHEA